MAPTMTSIVKCQKWIRFLNNIMFFLSTLCALSVAAYLAYRDMALVYSGLFLFLPCLASFFFREKITNPVLFVLCQLLLPLCLIPVFPRLILFLIYTVYFIGLTILSTYIKLKPNPFRNKNLPLSCFLSGIAAQAACFTLGFSSLGIFISILSLLFLILHFINRYLVNYVKFIGDTKESSHIPFAQIRSSNLWLLLSFLTLAVLLMLSSFAIPADTLAKQAGDGLLTTVRFLFGLIPQSGEGDRPFAILESGRGPTPASDDFSGSAEAGIFWTVLEIIMKYAMMILIPVGIICLILFAVYQFLKAFHANRSLSTDQIEYLSPLEKKEKARRLPDKVTDNLRNLFTPGTNGRIRKSFYHTIRGTLGRKTKIEASLSPEQLGTQITGAATDTAMQELTTYYEKARYSDSECSKEETVHAKKLADQLSKKYRVTHPK